MRVLFVSTYFPRDLRLLVHGVFKRMRMFIDAIKEAGELDMLFYVRPGTDVSPSAVAELERALSRHWNAGIRLFLCPISEHDRERSKWGAYGGGILSFFRQVAYSRTSGPDQVQALENCLDRKPDLVFAHKLPAMCPLLLTPRMLPPVFLDLDDIEHISLLRSINRQQKLHGKIVDYLRVPALFWGERRAIRLAHRTFVCSERDRRYLADRWRLPGIVTVPNGITLPELQPQTEAPTLLFVGSFLHRPNVDAAEYLIEQVWPHVHRAMPTARLIIAGNPPDRIHGYGNGIPGVEFTGFVEELDELYRRTRVVCAPILSGAGTRVKIIEAAAYGKPIVATTIGAEGLEMRDGSELLLRDDPNSFAEACIRLLKDTVLCRQLGAAVRAKAVESYDRTKIVRLIQSYLKDKRKDSESRGIHRSRGAVGAPYSMKGDS